MRPELIKKWARSNFYSRQSFKKLGLTPFNKGLALIAVIMLILFVGVAVLGVTQFIANRLASVHTYQRVMRCRYNAQAGVHYAIYQYRQSGATYSSGTTVNIDANNSFRFTSTGGGGATQASSLQIDARSSYLGGTGNKDILGVILTNTSASPITLSTFTISCEGGNKRLDEVRIGGTTVWSTRTTIGATPVTLNMTDLSIPAGNTSINYIRWSSGMSGRTIYLGFTMSDSSTTTFCQVYPAVVSVCSTAGGDLTIQSTGRTTGSSFYKTIQATYKASTGNISDYQEITSSVP